MFWCHYRGPPLLLISNHLVFPSFFACVCFVRVIVRPIDLIGSETLRVRNIRRTKKNSAPKQRSAHKTKTPLVNSLHSALKQRSAQKVTPPADSLHSAPKTSSPLQKKHKSGSSEQPAFRPERNNAPHKKKKKKTPPVHSLHSVRPATAPPKKQKPPPSSEHPALLTEALPAKETSSS